MEFEELLRRVNLNSLETFLLYGVEDFREPSDKTYSERIAEARRKAAAFFKARFPGIQEYDEISGYFDEQSAVFGEVYFEIGLILGAKFGFQIRKGWEELR